MFCKLLIATPPKAGVYKVLSQNTSYLRSLIILVSLNLSQFFSCFFAGLAFKCKTMLNLEVILENLILQVKCYKGLRPAVCRYL